MDVPFFLPTSSGDLSASASLPDDGELSGTPALLLTGGWHGRARTVMTLPLARRLAARGVPALRIDYPGSGLSSAARPVGIDTVVGLLVEAGTFFRDLCGARDLAVIGACLGGRLAVSVAARDPAVRHVVAVTIPVQNSKRQQRFALRRRPPEWLPRVVRDVGVASRTARMTFVFGSEDRAYRLFRAFLASSALPAGASARWDVIVREGARLHGFLDLSAEPERWLVDSIDAALAGRTGAGPGSAAALDTEAGR